MGTIVYLSIRLACACYILYKVCRQKKKIREICDLLYAKLPPVKQKEPENVLSEPGGESGVMGSTRFVYLDEDAGKGVAPYMSQPLETAAGFIGEEEDVAEEEVECKLPLEEMRILKEEQEELDGTYPVVDAVSQAVTPDDLDNAGNVLFKLNDADKDEEKSLRAALTLHTIRETDLFEIFSSQVENKNVIDSLMGKYLDGNGNPLPVRKIKSVVPVSDGWKQYL